MLAKIGALAGALHRWRGFLWAGIACAAIALVVGVVGGADSQGGILIALIALLWAGFLLALAYAFARPPATPARRDTAWTRFRLAVQLAVLWCLAVVSVVLGAALVWLTLRAASLAFG